MPGTTFPRPPRAVPLGLAVALCLAACGGDSAERGPPALPRGMLPPPVPANNADVPPPAIPFSPATPRVRACAVRSWPHDTAAFTQGLAVHRGRLLESTGLEGRSDLREVDAATGRVRRRVAVPAARFGEGIAVVGGRIHQLTWLSGLGYVYDASTLALADSFTYAGEGWGLATDGRVLYMSDGTSRLRVVEPGGFRVRSTVPVTEAGTGVYGLNELEWVRGELWANVYQTDLIARIDPATGRVMGWVDLGELLTPAERQRVAERGGVANGVAFDAARNRVLVTGKYWPRLFQIDLVPCTPAE